MVDDRPEDIGPSPDSGRAKRAPPTIDLEATEVSGERQNAVPARAAEPEPASPRPSAAAISAAVIAAVSGAGAAALVIGVAWLAGWPAGPRRPRRPKSIPPSIPPPSTTSPRVSPASSPGSASPRPPRPIPRPPHAPKRWKNRWPRCAANSPASARSRRSWLRRSTTRNQRRAKPAPPADLSAINERIAQIERAARAQSAADRAGKQQACR